MNRTIIIFAATCILAAATLFAQNTTAVPTLTIPAKRGKTFSVTLDVNKTTGYQWQLQPLDTTLVKFLHTKYSKSRSRALGTSGKETWTFKALGHGTATIVLYYVRPWEKDAPPARIVTLTVIIQ